MVLTTRLPGVARRTADESSRRLWSATHSHRLTSAGSTMGTTTLRRVAPSEAPQV